VPSEVKCIIEGGLAADELLGVLRWMGLLLQDAPGDGWLARGLEAGRRSYLYTSMQAEPALGR